MTRVLSSDDGASHSVHEVLGAFLSHGELVLTVSSLFVKHACVFNLSGDVLSTLFLFNDELFGFLLLILFEHLLKVHLLLLSLVGEHLTFSIHLFLESVDKLKLLVVIFLLLDTLSLLLKLELTVTRVLFLLDLLFVFLLLLCLFLSEELDVLSLHFIVLLSLRKFSLFSRSLSSHLGVKLLLNESLALLLTLDSLLLLFVVQEGVELLDSEPFVFLVNLRVDISLSGVNGRSGDLAHVITSTGLRSDTHSLTLG